MRSFAAVAEWVVLFALRQMFPRHRFQFGCDLFQQRGESDLFAQAQCNGVRVDMQAGCVAHRSGLRLALFLSSSVPQEKQIP